MVPLLPPSRTGRNQPCKPKSSSKARALFSTLSCLRSKSEYLIFSSYKSPSHFQKQPLASSSTLSALLPDQHAATWQPQAHQTKPDLVSDLCIFLP